MNENVLDYVKQGFSDKVIRETFNITQTETNVYKKMLKKDQNKKDNKNGDIN